MSSTPKTAPPKGESKSAPPKNMSNRLLTMKFMQRAAAASPSKTDTAAIKAAAAEETARREAKTLALRPRIPVPGDDRDIETQWQLSYVRNTRHNSRVLKVASVGFSELQIVDSDSEKEEEEVKEEENSGRLVFGNFRKKSEATPSKKEGDGSDSGDSSDSDEEDEDETPRRKKQMGKRNPLHGLTSISNAGSSNSTKCHNCQQTGHKATQCPQMECYACGGFGHRSSDCPNPRKRRKDTYGSRNYAHTKKARKSL